MFCKLDVKLESLYNWTRKLVVVYAHRCIVSMSDWVMKLFCFLFPVSVLLMIFRIVNCWISWVVRDLIAFVYFFSIDISSYDGLFGLGRDIEILFSSMCFGWFKLLSCLCLVCPVGLQWNRYMEFWLVTCGFKLNIAFECLQFEAPYIFCFFSSRTTISSYYFLWFLSLDMKLVSVWIL